MIYPTEMTLATGTTVYAGDPESDECIASREVRVSVTYRIEEDEDFDLADFAFARAADVERARLAAQERIEKSRERGQADACEAAFGSSKEAFDPEEAFDPSDPALEPPDEEENEEENDEDGVAPDPFPEEANYLSARCSPAANGGHLGNSGYPGSGEHFQNGTYAQNKTYAQNGLPAFPAASPAGMRRAAEAETVPQTDQVSPDETDWATKPQVLALGSHFRRLGLSPENQTALLRARFGKFRPERLTKDEAAGLMRYLERGEWEPTGAAAAH